MSAFSPAEPRELSRVYLEHALAGRAVEAAQTVIAAVVDDRIDLLGLFEDVIAPAARQVGELWHQARVTVADEHFVTQLNQKLIAVAAALRPAPQSNGERIVLPVRRTSCTTPACACSLSCSRRTATT